MLTWIKNTLSKPVPFYLFVTWVLLWCVSYVVSVKEWWNVPLAMNLGITGLITLAAAISTWLSEGLQPKSPFELTKEELGKIALGLGTFHVTVWLIYALAMFASGWWVGPLAVSAVIVGFSGVVYAIITWADTFSFTRGYYD